MAERLGKSICKTDDCEVFAVMESDVNSKRVAVNLYLEYKDGSITEPYSIPRKDIVGKLNCLDKYFLDIKGNFSDENIIGMKTTLNTMVKSLDSNDYIAGQSRATLEEILERIHAFIMERSHDNDDKSDSESETKEDSKSVNKKETGKLFFKDNYGCIETSLMDEFVRKNKDLKYSRVEILRWLKIRGLLEISNGRPYDYLESVNGKKVRVYKVDLSDVMETFMETPEETTTSEITASEVMEESEVMEDGNQTI